jgi:hypothetical protein
MLKARVSPAIKSQVKTIHRILAAIPQCTSTLSRPTRKLLMCFDIASMLDDTKMGTIRGV